MQFMFSDQSVIKLEIENRKIAGKISKYLQITHISVVNNTWVKEVSKEIKKILN